MQALELLLMRYRACLPYDTWRQVCMHFMYLLEGLLPPDGANSVNYREHKEHPHTGTLHVSSDEAVQNHLTRFGSVDDNTTEHDYTQCQHHAWFAAHAVVPAPASSQLPEEMAWDLLPTAQVAMQKVMYGVLHRLLHQPHPSVRCMHQRNCCCRYFCMEDGFGSVAIRE